MSTHAFSEILALHGKTAASVADGLSINKSTVCRWKQVPPERLLDVERITGIPRYELRPDLAAIFVDAKGSPAEREPAA